MPAAISAIFFRNATHRVVLDRLGVVLAGLLGSLSKVLTMRETQWYKLDLFGLRTADEAGKILFNHTAGNHLQFSRDELLGWLTFFV